MKKFLIALLVVVLLIGGYTWSSYNGLVRSDQNVQQSWAQVQNVYQRRADLIPNLVATVKGYAAHERNTLIAVTKARASVTKLDTQGIVNDPKKFAQFAKAQDALSQSLSRLLVTVERYPDLKASQNFLALQDQLEGTENRITVARRRFNIAAQSFNTKVLVFPRNLLAKWFGFKPKAYFKAKAGAQNAPQVKF